MADQESQDHVLPFHMEYIVAGLHPNILAIPDPVIAPRSILASRTMRSVSFVCGALFPRLKSPV